MRKIKTIISKTIEQTVKIFQALVFILFGSKRADCLTRANVVLRIFNTRRKNKGLSSSTFGEQLVLVDAILNIPPDKQGVVAEFGCFKGISTVAISIAAKYAGRRVVVFDSFEGLPEPKEIVHQMVSGAVIDYQKGAYAGTLEEVRSVVSKYGEVEQVEFVRGFFCDTLIIRPPEEKYVLIFEDADLIESVRDILEHAWPRLREGCIFFCHEALDLEVTKLFFNDAYWSKLHGQKSPGLAGVGMGLPIDWGKWGTQEISGRCGSSLAATIKRST